MLLHHVNLVICGFALIKPIFRNICRSKAWIIITLTNLETSGIKSRTSDFNPNIEEELWLNSMQCMQVHTWRYGDNGPSEVMNYPLNL